jgi:signal peptide peptidase SppA
VLNRPLLITPDKAQIILSVHAGRIGMDSPEASRFEGSEFDRDASGRLVQKPYKVSGGVAVVTITGSLVNRGAWIGASSGLTSYEGIQHQLKTAAADPAVHSILLDLHSPGGEAIGAFETAALVRQVARSKRVVALVNGMAASAAYAIPSGASEIVTTETGVSGSIGVVVLHADFSRKLDEEGITPTLIFAGAHKVDGNPFAPLPDTVRADIQAEVDAFYDLFLRTVAEGRGQRMTADAARATEARVFIGAAAVAAGLADRVGTFESVIDELKNAAGTGAGAATVQKRRLSMDRNATDTTADAETGIGKAEHDAAVKAARDEGFAAGVRAENARILAIEANALPGHDALVSAHKADSSVTPEASAIAILKAEREKPKDPRRTLEAMDRAAEGVESRPSASGDGGPAAPKATTPEGWKAEWEASAKLQGEYPTPEAYVAVKKREARAA